MPGYCKKATYLIIFGLCCGLKGGDLPGDWNGNYSPCTQHLDVLKRDHLDLGVRFSTADPGLAVEFARAMHFWATILDMEWHEEDSVNCSIQIVDGIRDLFQPAEVARAQFPGRPAFQGWIAFNPKAALARRDQYLAAVHELGHMLGLKHNPNAWSVMYPLQLEGKVMLDAVDLAALAGLHKLRLARLDEPVIVTVPSLDDSHGRQMR